MCDRHFICHSNNLIVLIQCNRDNSCRWSAALCCVILISVRFHILIMITAEHERCISLSILDRHFITSNLNLTCSTGPGKTIRSVYTVFQCCSTVYMRSRTTCIGFVFWYIICFSVISICFSWISSRYRTAWESRIVCSCITCIVGTTSSSGISCVSVVSGITFILRICRIKIGNLLHRLWLESQRSVIPDSFFNGIGCYCDFLIQRFYRNSISIFSFFIHLIWNPGWLICACSLFLCSHVQIAVTGSA